MDKRVILAVAGSGKTTYIVNSLDPDKRSLIITYTNNNYLNLRKKIIQRFGLFPENIEIYTYYNFLYSFCFLPYLGSELKANGINFKPPGKHTLKLKRSNMKFYFDGYRNLYSNRIARLLEEKNLNEIISNRKINPI